MHRQQPLNALVCWKTLAPAAAIFCAVAVVASSQGELMNNAVLSNDTAMNLAVNRHMGDVPGLVMHD